jgi:hypothetical protein
MADKKKGGGAALAIQGGAQIGAFAGTAVISEAGTAAIEALAMKDGEKMPAIGKAAVDVVTTGVLTGVALATKSGRKYAPAVVGGGLLKLVMDVGPSLGAWVRKKVSGMFTKGTEGVRGSRGISRVTNGEIAAGDGIRNLVN